MVVKVRAYQSDNVYFGSGVFLPPNLVLTAEHVLCGDRVTIELNGEEKEALVKKKNNVAALLSVKIKNDKCDEQLFFTDEECLDQNTKWCVEGFITDLQRHHKMSGKGVVCTGNTEDEWDYKLQNIEEGCRDNYRGLSGSPVICNNRIIGILQVQSYQEMGRIGIAFSSTTMFKDILPLNFYASTQYIEDLENLTKRFSETAIEKNISSKKYIPDIFVEEGNYKENFRYFSEPALFVNKIIEEIANLDLNNINSFLICKDEQPLDFSDIEEYFSNHTVFEISELIAERINDAIQRINNAKQRREKQNVSIESWYKGSNICDYSVAYVLEHIQKEICFLSYKTILITNDAGQGKTNFLCDFTRNFLLKKNFFVLFYNAYDFREKIMDTIKKGLTIDGAYTWEYANKVLTHIYKHKQRAVTIVIDGLNENTALADFEGYMVDFLKETQKLPFMKVIMSTRNELLEERFGKINCEELGSDFHKMNMTTRSDTFKHRIFRGYLSYFRVDIAENTLIDKTYDILTQDTLLLRFFCEVNQGKKQVIMWNIHKYSLFKKYYEIKRAEFAMQSSFSKEGLFDKLMNHLCQLMLNKKRFFKIPRDELSEEELFIIDKMLESDVLFKQETTIKNGFIPKTTSALSFTFDEFRDYCITKYILENYCDEKYFLEWWNRAHSETWTILEGVERYTFFLAKSEENDILPILKRCKEYNRIYWENVWELEEAHISQDDINNFKNEILNDGKFSSQVAIFLFMRQDRNYFSKTNVELLFDILDQLADNQSLFEKIIRDFFIMTTKDRYGIESNIKGTVLPCDKLISFFDKHQYNAEFIEKNVSFLKLSLYISTIYPSQIEKLWVNAFLTSPTTVEETLAMYLEKRDAPLLICCNIRHILIALIREGANNQNLTRLMELLDKRLRRKDYIKVNEEFGSIWDM